MPTTVVAHDGDTLCGIAIARGFLDCALFRAEGANAPYTQRPLRHGDVVTIPDHRVEPVAAPTNRVTKLRVKRRPVPQIRFVHGSPDKPAPEDPSLRRLAISNYKTDMAGPSATDAFTAAFGFDAHAHEDEDAFKVEVVSPDGGAPIQIRVEALRPSYDAHGVAESWAPFGGAHAAGRVLTAEGPLVDGHTKRHRTRYLRLVSDDVDQAALPQQTVMVSDIADGNDGPEDRVEILDQHVLASYELPACPAGSHKCTLRKELPIGSVRRRLRIFIHVFRAAAGGAAIGGTTAQMVRRRTYKWFRRLYAQADMAPKLLGIDEIDPPPADTIVISQGHGRPASGTSAPGVASTVSFTLDWPPGGAPPGAATPLVRVPLSGGQSPRSVCARIAAALPAGYAGEVQINTQALDGPRPSCDLRVTHTSGARIRIRGEATTDPSLTITVARVDITNVDVLPPGFPEMLVYTPEARRILRSGTPRDDRLDVYVVGSIVGARGVAMIPGNDLRPQHRPVAPLRWATIIRDTVMNGGDNDPFSYPHEAGHVMNDAFHADQTTPPAGAEMMAGGGTNGANAMDATKRISDGPVEPLYAKYDPAQAAPGAFHVVAIEPVNRFRRRGAPLLEGW